MTGSSWRGADGSRGGRGGGRLGFCRGGGIMRGGKQGMSHGDVESSHRQRSQGGGCRGGMKSGPRASEA